VKRHIQHTTGVNDSHHLQVSTLVLPLKVDAPKLNERDSTIKRLIAGDGWIFTVTDASRRKDVSLVSYGKG
jgi:hypothetical protein